MPSVGFRFGSARLPAACEPLRREVRAFLDETLAGYPAQRRAYTSGHVFAGSLELPTIDHRQYLERELDMHNVHQSFALRQGVGLLPVRSMSEDQPVLTQRLEHAIDVSRRYWGAPSSLQFWQILASYSAFRLNRRGRAVSLLRQSAHSGRASWSWARFRART